MLDSVLAAGRAAAISLMVDACEITRAGGPPVWDETLGDYTHPTPVLVWSGPCRVQTRQLMVGEADVGERVVGLVRVEIHVPVEGTTDVARGDTVTITGARFDPALVGRAFTVQSGHAGTHKTARRLSVETVAREGDQP